MESGSGLTASTPDTQPLSERVGFEILGQEMGRDLESALEIAVSGGVVFSVAGTPLAIFRQALAESIRDIETHPRGRLFQDFLTKGPYEGEGTIPADLRGERLTDEETAAVITFIYAHMVNCFKGALTELFATVPCLNVVRQLQQTGELPESTRLYVGDAVKVLRTRGTGTLRGADLHVLILDLPPSAASRITVAGVAEVKSYKPSKRSLQRQLDRHILRAGRGFQVCGTAYSADRVTIGVDHGRRVYRIAVEPDRWRLPRTFRFDQTANGRSLHVDPGVPPSRCDRIERHDGGKWQITLRWSREALAAAAYEMTFWYMEKVGEVVYSHGVPKEWSEMSAAEAGRNAAKMMLYYAILRSRDSREDQRAIALYNSYGFGYALGMGFSAPDGKRTMLWPEDLDEILKNGKTKSGCRVSAAHL